MKLKKLEMSGFKSFPEKASIHFPTGISAVVGPNGCGKSNIIDALRWVMGEQSVKQLRGKSMEDVIFAGSKGKPPLNMAEVSLTLLNDNGSAPEELKDFTEINITRRLFRSGESAYLINRQPCRLKDIHHIFMGTGMGARTYAVIQQGNIGAITDATPEERRLFIEEAAGVTRYKNRKKEAIRKVESTHQNLLRVNDILLEISRQMAGLKRQARRAERYKKLKKRIKRLDIRLGLHYHDAYAREIKTAEALLTAEKDQDLRHTSRLKAIDAAVEKIKLQRTQKDQAISRQKSRQFETQRYIDRCEADIKHLKDDIQRLAREITELESAGADLKHKNTDIAAEMEQVTSEGRDLENEKDAVGLLLTEKRDAAAAVKEHSQALGRTLEKHKTALMELVTREARYKNTYQTAADNRSGLAKRQQRTAEEASTAEKEVAREEQQVQRLEEALNHSRDSLAEHEEAIQILENRLLQHKQELADQVKAVQTLEFEKTQVRSQLLALKKMDESYAWYKDGVRSIMQARRAPEPEPSAQEKTAASKDNGSLGEGILGLMADIVEPEASYAAAVEAVLGESLQYILVKDQQYGIDGIQHLQHSGAGRAGFIPLPAVKTLPSAPPPDPGDPSRLVNHLSVKSGFESMIKALLGHVVVADSMADAVKRYNANGKTQTIVTKNGNLISQQGAIVGGSKQKLAGILSKKQEMRTLGRRVERIDTQLVDAGQHQQRMEAAVRGLEDQLQQNIEHKNQAARKAVDTEKALYKATADRKHARQRLEILSLEQERLIGEESEISEQLKRFKKDIEEIETQVKAAQQAVAETTAEIQQVASQAEKVNQEVVDLQLKMTTIEAGVANSRHTLRRLREFWQDSNNRLEQLAREINRKAERRAAAGEKVQRQEKELEEQYRALTALTASLESAEADYHAVDNALKKSDQQIQDLHSEREKTLQKIRLLELEQSQRIVKQENIAGRLEEKYHQPVDRLREASADDAADAPPVEKMEADLETARQKITRIGEVNLSAIQEYETHKERHDFLSAQRDDLVNAIEDLHRVIRKINRITQERFMATFTAVNEKLGEVVPKLFEGGSAKLILTNAGDPLETGVEFMIHPPGKKLTRMSLLSGGEKALAAIAFIFSIFLIKPTSFCLMDEIDAPLDEANVYRFNNLLQVIGRQSQIIMITHNKRTMEFADTLFGITMGEKGVSKVVSVNFEKPQTKVA